MKKILIWIDDHTCSVKVTDIGISLAKNLNTQMSLIYIIDDHLSLENEYRVKETEARKLLEGLLTKFNCSAVIYIEHGDPVQKILEKAYILNVDIIVAGIEIKKERKKNEAKSVGEQLSVTSEIPILLVPLKNSSN